MDIFDAIRHDPENVPDMILEDGFDDLEAEDRLGNSPLHIAVEQGEREIIIALLEAGVNPDIRNDEGMAPIHVAASMVEPGLLKVLGENGADIDAKDRNGMTALHYGAGSEKGCVDVLLALGADTSVKDAEGMTPLHHAMLDNNAARDMDGIVKALVAHGADIHAKDNDGDTPYDFVKFREIQGLQASEREDAKPLKQRQEASLEI